MFTILLDDVDDADDDDTEVLVGTEGKTAVLFVITVAVKCTKEAGREAFYFVRTFSFTAPISVSIALSQPPVYTARPLRPRIWGL